MKLTRKNKKGFTIIELVIVIAVIGVLTAVLVPTFINLTKSAKEASDDALINNLNKQLEIAESRDPDYETTTYQKVIDIVDEAGYKIPNLVSKSGEDLFWNQNTNRFYLGNKLDNDLPKYTYWTIKDALDGTEDYSVYAGLEFKATKAENLKAGFDVGSNAHIKEVNYIGNDSKQDGVTFRFLNDEFNADFKNNNDNQDEVKVYGNPNAVNSEKSGQQSLYIYEDIASLEVKEGHVVVAPGVKIGSLIFKATSTNNFDKIVVEIPDVNSQVENIYRSGVSTNLDAGVKVEVATIKTAQKSETYFLAGNGTIGETTDTSYLLVSTTGNVEQAVPVTEANASDAAKAIANAKDPDTGDVIDTGKTDNEIEVAKDEAKAEKQTEVAEKKAEEAGEDFSKYSARIGLKGYETFTQAYNAAVNGDTISLLKDIDLSATSFYAEDGNHLFIKKSITIDGCNNEITLNKRGFGLTGEVVSFRNITLTNSAAGGRCIDIRGKASAGFTAEVNLDNVKLDCSLGSGWTQPFTVGGDTSGYLDEDGNIITIKVNINYSEIITGANGTTGYAFITFNPVDLVITDSSVNGWANFYFKGVDGSAGSQGSTMIAKNCDLYSKNIYSGATNSFGLVKYESKSTTYPVNVTFEDNNINIVSTGNQQQSIACYESLNNSGNLTFVGKNVVNLDNGTGSYGTDRAVFAINRNSNTTLTVANGTVIETKDIENCGIAELLNSNQELRDDGNNTYTVVAKV